MNGFSGIVPAASGGIPLSGRAGETPALIAREAQNGFSGMLKLKQMTEQDRIAPRVDSAELDSSEKKQLYEQCRALETFLIKNLLQEMRKTVPKSDFIDTGFAGEMYEDMLWDEYAKTYAENADFGFAEMAYRELEKKLGGRQSL